VFSGLSLYPTHLRSIVSTGEIQRKTQKTVNLSSF
jgi:hypothetical protein